MTQGVTMLSSVSAAQQHLILHEILKAAAGPATN
jgi:hypothetical protein